MLAYTANRPIAGKRQSSPNAMLLIISAHVALVAVVMSAKMDLPARFHPVPIKVTLLPHPLPPPPKPPHPVLRPINTPINQPEPLRPNVIPQIDLGPPAVDPGSIAGAGATVVPHFPNSVMTPVHHDPRLLTPPSELKPPYPASKLLSEEETVLTLRLSIDERGRVVAVDPVGRADGAFLDAARRHMMAHWRYQPATEDGKAIASFLTVTLRFQLDG